MARLLASIYIALAVGCGGHASNPGSCHDLSLGDCRVAPGCKPDICNACVCDLNYRGCLGEAETPTPCPQLGCAGGSCCSTDAQCSSQATCARPGTPPACGACNTEPGDCTTDAQCKAHGATQICEPVPCNSCMNQKKCTQGCVDDTTCGEGTHCDLASARCVALPCTSDVQCPDNFGCGSGSTCTRAACSTDLDCDGYCVLGACFTGALGECVFPAP